MPFIDRIGLACSEPRWRAIGVAMLIVAANMAGLALLASGTAHSGPSRTMAAILGLG